MSALSSGTGTFHMTEAVADRLEGAPRQLRRRWFQGTGDGGGIGARGGRLGDRASARHSPTQLFGWRRVVLDARQVSTEPARCQIAAASTGEAVIEVVIGDVIVRARVHPVFLGRTPSSPSM